MAGAVGLEDAVVGGAGGDLDVESGAGGHNVTPANLTGGDWLRPSRKHRWQVWGTSGADVRKGVQRGLRD